MSESSCLAVMYHYVRDRAGGPDAGIRGLDLATFERQLDRLCAELEPVDWPQLYAWFSGWGDLPRRAFTLTFDDGLADHAEVVCPRLKARGLRGTFFVPARVLADGRMLPAHQIHLLQCRLGDDGFAAAVTAWLGAAHAGARDWLEHVDAQAAVQTYHYETAARATFKYLLTQTLPIELRNRMLDELFARHVGDSSAVASRWYVSWDQLAAMQSAGHTIGGHGLGHEPYLRLTPDEQMDDAAQSAQLLNDGLGVSPRPFSYPYGSFSEASTAACRAAGFVHAFTTHPVWIERGSDAYALGRVDTISVEAFLEQELAIAPS